MSIDWATIQDILDRLAALEEAVAKAPPSAPVSSAPLSSPSPHTETPPAPPRPDSAMTAPDAERGYN